MNEPMYKNEIVVFLIITCLVNDLEGLKIDDDLVSRHGDVVRQRMSEVRQFLVPLPDDQWDQLYSHFGSLLIPINAESEVCRNHSMYLLQSFLDSEIWALRMVDASSKIQSGILDGNLIDLGNYAQCISVDEPNKLFRGQHCVIETDGFLPPQISDIISHKVYKQFIPVDVMLSLCVPSSCSDRDVTTHVERTLSPLGVSATSYLDLLQLSTDIPRISCSSADGLAFRKRDYCAMVLFASLAMMVILATSIGANSGWLSHFSLLTNYKHLVDTTAAPDEVTCINGLRVIAIILVHLYHRAIQLLVILPSNRLLTTVEIFTSPAMALLDIFSNKAVDTFFLVGGCVLSYSVFLKYKNREKNFSFMDFCIKRYFRVTPVLAVLVLYEATMFVHSGSGPLWLRYAAPKEDACYVNWWTAVLHISDMVNPDYMCIGQSWYIACDYKLQCFSAVLLLLLLRKPGQLLTFIILCMILSLALFVFVAFYFQLESGLFTSFIYVDRLTEFHFPLVYYSPLFRGSHFFMGLLLGYLIFHFKQSDTPFSLSKRAAWLGWTLCLATLVSLSTLAVKLMEPDHQLVPVLDHLFVPFCRFIFCACVSWIIFACHYNGGGYVNKFLSWPGFRPLARLVFSFYLCHMEVVFMQILSLEAPFHLRIVDQLFLWLGETVICVVVAAVLYLTIEMPFYKLANSIVADWRRNSNVEKP